MTLKEALNNEEINRKVEEVENAEDVARILEEYGVEFTAEDLISLVPADSGELTDENLEDVAGGIGLPRGSIIPLPPGPFPRKIPNLAALFAGYKTTTAIWKFIRSNPLLKKLYKL